MTRGRKFHFTEEQDALIIEAFKLESSPPVKVNVAETSRNLAKIIPTSPSAINDRKISLKTRLNLSEGWQVKRFGRLPRDEEALRVSPGFCQHPNCQSKAIGRYCEPHSSGHANDGGGHDPFNLRDKARGRDRPELRLSVES